ncbi:MAG: ribosome biogenesis/translation initiation ATPase RLI [Candidatus Asgardarchaeia archaeon]
MPRIAVIDPDKCRFKDCNKECYHFCPEVRMGVKVIEFTEKGNPIINEVLCTGCGICIKKCPFKAISIVNLPEELTEDLVHQYGENTFRLYRLPIPKFSKVTGLVGPNGAGKSTAMKILAGQIKPNLGNFKNPPDWDEIIRYFRGSELQPFFQKMAIGELKIAYKPQYITKLPQVVKGNVGKLLEKVDERNVVSELKEYFELEPIWDRDLSKISGGELQKVAISAVIARDADVYLFDEPSSYLDVRERIKAAKLIHKLSEEGRTVVIVEHDLAVLDYLSDTVCIFYGKPGTYGIVSLPYAVRTGINIYLDGYLPEENVRFRDESIKFHASPVTERQWAAEEVLFSYDYLEKAYNGFKLTVEPGDIHKGEVIGILGPNGIGKTTFVKLIAGLIEPTKGKVETEGLKISYKPQYLQSDYDGFVNTLLLQAIGPRVTQSDFKSSVLRPLGVDKLLDMQVSRLSGGELQRVAIAACLGRDADIYLLDEPSAFLDIEERLAMVRVIRRVTKNLGKAAFVVEHDIIVQDAISDRLIVFSGAPGKEGYAQRPVGLREGMNIFLRSVGVTFRRDPQTGRPRVNKEGSRLDRMQKEQGEYYYIPKTKEREDDESSRK